MSNEELLNEYETAVVIFAVFSDHKDKEATANAEKRMNAIKAEILRRMNK